MTDNRFTKIVRDLVEWGLEGGHTTKQRLLEVEGLSDRKAAEQLGVRAARTVDRGVHPNRSRTRRPQKDEAQDVCNTLAADLGAAINGFAVGTPEVSVDERKAQHAALEGEAPAEQSAVLEQVVHTLTIPLHAEPADIARQIIDAFGGERAASIAGEILRAATEEKEAPKRARGRPPGSKNKAKAAL
jgi:hypothetical protein